MSNEENPNLTDSLKIKDISSVSIRDTMYGKLLKNFITIMQTVGEDAQEMYEYALKELQEYAKDVIIEIIRAEGASNQGDYPFRWALIHTAAELKHPDALGLLKNLVLSPIPPEKSKDPHSFSTVAEETILRTTAVEGVEYLSKIGNNEAQEALFEFLEIPSISIRRASVQAILATIDDKNNIEKMKSLIPKSQHFLLELKRVDVSVVPQIEDPQKHLREEVRDLDVKEPPRFPEKPNGDSPKTYRRMKK